MLSVLPVELNQTSRQVKKYKPVRGDVGSARYQQREVLMLELLHKEQVKEKVSWQLPTAL